MSDGHPSSNQEPLKSPGQYLRSLRHEKNLSIEMVTEATKITGKNIRAIEGSLFEQLPADTFVRGLVTLYGNFLDIDGSKVAAEFLAERKQHATGSRPQNLTMKTIPPSTLAPKKLAEPSHVSSATVALVLLAAIILSFSGFCFYTSWNPFAFLSKQTSTMQASIQRMIAGDKAPETNIDGARTIPETRESTTAHQVIPADKTDDYPYRLSAHFLRDCTATVSIDGQKPIIKKYTSGQVAHWAAQQQLKITFDTSKAATLSLNNAPLSFPNAKNDRPPSLLLPDDVFDHQ